MLKNLQVLYSNTILPQARFHTLQYIPNACRLAKITHGTLCVGPANGLLGSLVAVTSFDTRRELSAVDGPRALDSICSLSALKRIR